MLNLTPEQLTALAPQLNALAQAIADLQAPVVTPPVVVPDPVPDIPTSASGMTAVIQAISGKTFSIPADKYVTKDQTTAVYWSGRKSHIVNVVTIGSVMWVTTNEIGDDTDAKVAAMVGKPVTIIDRYPSTTTPPVVTPDPPVVTPPVTTPTTKIGSIGANLGMGAGGTSGPSGAGVPGLPGTNTHNYNFCPLEDIQTAQSLGMKHARVGTVAERLWKPTLKAELYRGKDSYGNNYVAEEVLRAGKQLAAAGIRPMWDFQHNYGKQSTTNADSGAKDWGTGSLTQDLFVAQVGSFLGLLKEDATVWANTRAIDLMNEWSGTTTVDWVVAAYQAAMTKWGAFAEHIVWSLNGMQYSNTQQFATLNAKFATLKHPVSQDLIEFSPHLYLDAGSDGYYDAGDAAMSATAALVVGVNRLKPALAFAKACGVGINVGEINLDGDAAVLLPGYEATLRLGVESGAIMYEFGISKDFAGNHHDIMLPSNAAVLAVTKKLISEYKI